MISIKGDVELISLFGSVGRKAASSSNKATQDGANLAASEVRKRAKGRIKNRISVAQVNKDTYEIEVDEPGIYLELGTSKMKAQPFMRPAIDQNAVKIADKITESLDLGI